jgi:hypothetical protein
VSLRNHSLVSFIHRSLTLGTVVISLAHSAACKCKQQFNKNIAAGGSSVRCCSCPDAGRPVAASTVVSCAAADTTGWEARTLDNCNASSWLMMVADMMHFVCNFYTVLKSNSINLLFGMDPLG